MGQARVLLSRGLGTGLAVGCASASRTTVPAAPAGNPTPAPPATTAARPAHTPAPKVSLQPPPPVAAALIYRIIFAARVDGVFSDESRRV